MNKIFEEHRRAPRRLGPLNSALRSLLLIDLYSAIVHAFSPALKRCIKRRGSWNSFRPRTHKRLIKFITEFRSALQRGFAILKVSANPSMFTFAKFFAHGERYTDARQQIVSTTSNTMSPWSPAEKSFRTHRKSTDSTSVSFALWAPERWCEFRY